MLPAQFAKTGSVSAAVENTFDGKHPCAMCKTAEALRESQAAANPQEPVRPKSEQDKQLTKHLTSVHLQGLRLPARSYRFSRVCFEAEALVYVRKEKPATPPPDFC